MCSIDKITKYARACWHCTIETVFCVLRCRKDMEVSKDRQEIDDEIPGSRVSTVPQVICQAECAI
jgi:hypothetical protein